MSLVARTRSSSTAAFGAAGLGARVLRLSCAIEETACSRWARTAPTDCSCRRLFRQPGDRSQQRVQGTVLDALRRPAPTLNALGQSTYEGVSFLRGLMAREEPGAEIGFDSVRATCWRSNRDKATPIYLAQAEVCPLAVVQKWIVARPVRAVR